MRTATHSQRGPLFSPREVVRISLWFVGLFALAWGLSQGVALLCRQTGIPADIPSKWPVSLVQTRLSRRFPDVLEWPTQLGVAMLSLGLFAVAVHRFWRQTAGTLPGAMLLGFVLMLGTNLIHGPRYGLVYPHQGWLPGAEEARQYYHDAARITSAGEFLRQFNAVQLGLECHSRTHPPGAVLFYYAMIRAVGHGAAVSLVVAAVSVALSGAFFYGLVRRDFDAEKSSYTTLLLLLIPAVQVYYCASLDAVIAGCFLGVIAFLRHPNGPLSVAGMIGCLLASSFLTFGACFLVPVLLGFELLVRKGWQRSAGVILGLVVAYRLTDLLWGFDYLAAFRAAAASENPGGFLLWTAPVSYLMTRLENVGDIAVFLGPLLLVLLVRGVRVMRAGTSQELAILTALGLGTLAAMFLSGAMRTGETARACLFIYPYLILPVAVYLHQLDPPTADKRRLLWLVFGQSVLMQTAAGYYW